MSGLPEVAGCKPRVHAMRQLYGLLRWLATSLPRGCDGRAAERRDTFRVKRMALIAGTAALLTGAGITTADAAGGNTATIQTVSIGTCTTEGAFVSCSVQGDIAHP